MTNCVPCGRGFHKECRKGCKKCHPEVELEVEEGETSPSVAKEIKARKKGATRDGLKDPQSTGRKRAARLYPLDKEAECEWRSQKNCGGGRVPIVGCLGGLQEARHHGPVKNTTRNHNGNVHRICTRCHNHWHELNDLVYDEKDYAILPHDPMPATDEEIAHEELLWFTGEKGKKFELASSKKGKLKLVD